MACMLATRHIGGLPRGIWTPGWGLGMESGRRRGSPLQGLSSPWVPLHRNWSVTTSLTSVRLGNVVLSSRTTLTQFVHCRRGRRGHKDGVSKPRAGLARPSPAGSWVQGRDGTARVDAFFYCSHSSQRAPSKHTLLFPALPMKSRAGFCCCYPGREFWSM